MAKKKNIKDKKQPWSIPLRAREDLYNGINPSAGFGIGSFLTQGAGYLGGFRTGLGMNEDEARWAAYLGLPYDKEYAPDTKIRFEHDKDYPDRQYQGVSKRAKNEIREEVIPEAKRIKDEYGKEWIQVLDERGIFGNDSTIYHPRETYTGDLGKFGIREVGNSGIYEIGDKYDFPSWVPVPDRNKGTELMIRDTIWSDRADPKLYKKEIIKRKNNKYGFGSWFKGAAEKVTDWNTNVTDKLMGSKFGQGLSKLGINSGNIGGIANIGATAIGGLLAGGKESGVGNTMQKLGSLASNIPGVGGMIGAGVNLAGGVYNALLGSRLNKEEIAKVEGQIGNLKSFTSDASDYDALASNYTNMPVIDYFSKDDIGSDGLFSNKAEDKWEELKKEKLQAELWAHNSLFNNAQNIATNKQQLLEANYTAYGGPINMKYTGTMSPFGNQFDEGGPKNSIPTQEEYIAQQIAAKRAAALDKSRNRTSVRIPMVPNKRPIDVWEGLLNNDIEYAEESLSRAMAEGNKKLAALRQEELDAYLKEKDAGYPKLVPGANCMYNAGDCYGLNIPGNQTFVAKHKELGFKKAPKGSMEPGDIVQDVRGGTPIHAMIYDSKDAEGNLLFNYARGNGYADLENGYVKQGEYPLPIKDYDVYKYVGTPADSTQWINEYKEMYNKKAEGGNLFTNGVTFINNGDSHENNPLEGVQIGVDPQGIPNLVEEGEVIYDDYVFSNRLRVPKEVRQKYKLRGVTFADAAKQIQKESEERPNDKIARDTMNAIMSELTQEQEMVRAKKLSNKYARGGKLCNKFDDAGPIDKIDFPYSVYSSIPQDPFDFSKWFTVDKNNLGKVTSYTDAYRNYNFTADKAREWAKLFGNDESLKSYLSRGNKLEDLTDEDVQKGSLDKKHGWLHKARAMMANLDSVNTPDIEGIFGNLNKAKFTPIPIKDVPIVEDEVVDEEPLPAVGKEVAPMKTHWLRYAPLGINFAAVTNDLLGGNEPDYTNANMFQRAIEGTNRPIRGRQIGNYLRYNPFDTNYYINILNANTAAARRAAMNTSGGNRAAALAGVLAADYNHGNQLGALARQAEEYNLAQRQKVEEFNRGTNTTNAEMAMKADMANAEQAMQRARMYGSLAEYRDKILATNRAEKSANLTNFIQSLGNLGTELTDKDKLRWLAELGVLKYDDEGKYTGKKSNESANGGRINRKKRGGFTI